MRTSDIKRLGEAYASVVESSKVKEDKKQFVYAAKMAKDKGEKEFTFAGKKYDVEEALNGNMVECVDEKDFKPHMMYDPKTGKGVMAKKYADHVKMDKMGYTHEKPEDMKEETEEVEEAYHGKNKKTEDNTNDKSDDGDGMDKVQPKAVKKKFKDRKDKDIDNDGDVDSSDEYLHKRRKAVSKAVSNEEDENGEEENGDEKDKKKKMPFPPKKKDDGNGDEEHAPILIV